MARVGIALGSNLGERLSHLSAARTALQGLATVGESFLQASIYQTEPLLCPPDSPPFYNTVVEFDYLGLPLELLQITQDLEKILGRTSVPVRNSPRVIDIDLLYFGGEIICDPVLTLPHPRLHQRRFVLQPLAEICPKLVLPGHALRIEELLESLDSVEPPLISVTECW
jgi:2-amino-4-hydroxy-6-hydroxymethyldihydropteridine diphosphokinase